MRKVLIILGQLEDADVEWMAGAGLKRRCDEGSVLIAEGGQGVNMFIVLQGQMNIVDKRLGIVATLGTGEIVGEMSFVDDAPPSVSVVAAEDCVVLELSHQQLEERINTDAGFGLRFYRALSFFLADRLRGTMKRFGYGESAHLDADEIMEDELDEKLLDTVSMAGDRFDRMLRTLASAKSV